jgi:hypothetical protein
MESTLISTEHSKQEASCCFGIVDLRWQIYFLVCIRTVSEYENSSSIIAMTAQLLIVI